MARDRSDESYDESEDDDNDEEKEKEAKLFIAINDGDLKKVRELLGSMSNTQDIINRNIKNNTPLHSAVEKGKKEIVEELLHDNWKMNVDARNSRGDTALHIASFKGNKVLVRLLLDNRAKADITNKKCKTALELAKDKEIIDILTVKSQMGADSGKQKRDQRQKRREHDSDDAQLKRLKILQGEKRTAEGESDTDDDRTKKLKTSGEYSASGLKTSLHGTVYQLKLLMLFIKRGVNLGYNFILATEMDAAEKMDDLVFRYDKGDKKVFRFLQAKHKQNETKMISVNDFLTETNGEFSLQKYFISFRNIKNNPIFNGVNDEIQDLIMCTNIDYNSDDKRGDLELKNVFEMVRDENGDEKIDDILKTVLIKFKDDFNGKEQIVKVLRNSSDLIKLAKKLADCALDGKTIDKSKNNDASDNLFKLYQFALAEEVIDVKLKSNKRLQEKFIDGKNLSPEAESFRNAFEQVFVDRRKSYNLDDNPYINKNHLQNFSKEIAALMAEDKSSKPVVKVNKRKKVIRENFDKLAGYVLVMKDGKKQFSTAFLRNKPLPGNLETFRNELKNELWKQNIPTGTGLEKYTFDVYESFKTCEEIYVDKKDFWKQIKEMDLKLFQDFGKNSVESLTTVDKFVSALALLIDESRNEDEDYIVIEGKNDVISRNIDKLAKHALIEDNEKLRFSSEFLSANSLPGNLYDFKHQLTGKVKDLGDCRFEIKNFPKLHLPKDSIAKIDNDIKSYFNHLVFALKQPSEIALDKIIRDEMGGDKDINLIDSDFLASQFQKEMLDWMKEKKGRFLDHEDGMKFFDEVTRKLARLVLTCPSLEYRAKFEELNIRFNSVEKELWEFLEPDNKKQIFNLISSPDTILGSIKVYQTLKSMPAYKRDDSYIFIRQKSLLRIQDRVANAFGSRSRHLLVIECKPLEETVEESYEELFEVIKSKKKIILITEKENTLSITLKYSFKSKYVEKNIEVENLLDLTYESQNKLLNDGRVIFQGSEVALGRLINVESLNLIDAGALSTLVNNKRLEIAEPLRDLEDVRNYYRPRTLIHQVKINNHFQKDTSRFYVTYDSRLTDENLSFDRDIIFVADETKDFEELCDVQKKHNNHWLKKLNAEFTWQKSRGALSKLREFVDRRKESILAYRPEKVTDFEEKVVIIAAEPGMGKSTVLTNLAVETKASDPTLWVAKINLSIDCATELESLTESEIKFNKEKRFEFLLKTAKVDKELDKKLFRDCYERGNIVLLFDGFDEISPHYKTKVIELLKFLESTQVAKIWVTTRPYNIKDDLEDALSTFAYTMEEFSEDDRRIFLQNFWSTTLKFEDQLDAARANIFIDKLIDKFTRSINDQERKFVSIPLQLKMIADIFKGIFCDFYNSDSDELSEEQKQQFEKKLDMIGLYESFFDVKFDDILFGEKAPGLIKAISNVRDTLDERRKKVKDDHKELALYSLYGKVQVKSLPLKERKQDLLEMVKLSKDKVGIIDRVEYGRPVFVHRTFAEYFAALWFTENFATDAVNKFIEKRFFVGTIRVTQNFFDRILAKDDNNRYEIHNAVLSNDEVRVKSLIKTNGAVFEIIDKAKRTPLHLAAAYGYKEIARSLLEAARERHQTEEILSAKDGVFNWSPLSYADQGSHWDTAEYLLRNGANGGDMFNAIDSIKNTNNMIGRTLLHVAAKDGYFEFAKFLIKNGADVNATDTNSKTPLHFAAEEGRLSMVKCFVEDEQVDVKTEDKYRRTPVHLAAKGGHLDVVKYFIDGKKVDVKVRDKWGMTSLHLAAQNGMLNVVKYLIEEKKMDVATEDESDQVALHMAAQYGHLETVEYLVNEAADLNTVNKIAAHGGTPLHLAAQYGRLEVLKYLMKNGAEFDIVDDSTPLHWAALHGKLEVVDYLIESENADIEAPEYDGSTLLHLATLNGHLTLVEYLVNEKNANLEAFDNNGETPLHTAAKCGKIHVVKFLADKKIRTINLKNKNGDTPSSLAADGFLDVVRYLVDMKNADVGTRNETGQTLLHKAASSSNALPVVRYLLEEKRVDFIAKDNEGSTALHLAARNGRSDVVNYFIERIDENRGKLCQILFDTEEYGMTPLHYAALNNHEEVVEDLLKLMKNYPELLKELIEYEEGSDVSAKDNCSTVKLLLKRGAKLLLRNYHHTIIHESVGSDDEETVKLIANILREYNENNIDLRDREGNTPLIWAARDNKAIAAEMLLDFGADVNAQNNEKKTALHLAIINRHGSMVKFLTEDKKTADIEAEDENGRRPLHWAAEEREWDIATYLIDSKSAEVNAADKDLRTPLHWAAADGNLYMVKILTDKQANFVAPDKDGNTPLHLAAHGGELETVKYLAEEKCADFDTPNDWGNTPLHLAAQEGKLNTVNYLLNRLEENPTKLNELLFDIEKYGMTPLHYAALNAREKVVDVLLDRIRENEENFKASILFGEEKIAYGIDHRDNNSLAKLLLERGAELFLTNKRYTIVHEAIRGNDKIVMELILKTIENATGNSDLRINERDDEGNTPLMWAVKRGKIDAAKILLAYGAGFDIRNKDGQTALYFAAKIGYQDIVQLLMDHGADPNIGDNEGKTPFGETRNQNIANLLAQAT